MAPISDNLTLNAGAGGATLATDEIGGVHTQIVKLSHGGLDSSTLVSTASGLPVQATDLDIRDLTATDVVTVTGGAGQTADVKVTLDSEAVVLGAGSAAIGKLVANSGVDIGDVDVTSISAGSNLIGDVALQGRTTGGLTLYKNIDVDETEDQVAGVACTLFGFYAYNNAAAGTKRFLKLYNATAAAVTVGTTAPDMTFELDGGQGMVFSVAQGIAFGTALTVAATTAVADNDSGAPAANDVLFQAWYK